MKSTKEIIDHHLKTFAEQDLNGILSDYAPGAILLTPQGPLRGPDAIRPLFQTMIAEFAKPGAQFNMKQQFVEGPYAYILEPYCVQHARGGLTQPGRGSAFDGFARKSFGNEAAEASQVNKVSKFNAVAKSSARSENGIS